MICQRFSRFLEKKKSSLVNIPIFTRELFTRELYTMENIESFLRQLSLFEAAYVFISLRSSDFELIIITLIYRENHNHAPHNLINYNYVSKNY